MLAPLDCTHKHRTQCFRTRLEGIHPNTASGTHNSASRSKHRVYCFPHLNTGFHTLLPPISHYTLGGIHTNTRSVPLPQRPDSVLGSRGAAGRAPSAPSPYRDTGSVNIGPAGTLGAGWPDLLPRRRLPHPHSRAGRLGIPGTSWTWQAAPPRLPEAPGH